jgi:hypothetical protein
MFGMLFEKWEISEMRLEENLNLQRNGKTSQLFIPNF